MSAERPPIKENVKRAVRQRCGFGCVICGLPLYHYDHMTEYSVVLEHDADNITLLCGYHHDMKTRGQLSDFTVRKYNNQPKNKDRTVTSAHSLLDFGDRAEIIIGGNRIIASGHAASALRIDGQSLIDVELIDGSVFFNVDFRDADGNPVLTVKRSELVHSTHFWDYTFEGTTLTINEEQRKIYVVIEFKPEEHQVVVNKGLVSHNGIDLLFDKRGMCILNNRMFFAGNSMQGLDAAISIGTPPQPGGTIFLQADIPRGPYDREAAIKWARMQMKNAENYLSRGTRQPSTDSAPKTIGGVSALYASPYAWERTTCGVAMFWP